jgi:hypothetical protein
MPTYERLDYGSSDGCQIGGAATDKVGFFGTTPADQRSGAAQAALTATTIGAVGLATTAGVSALLAQLEEIRATLAELGLFKGST